MAAAVVEHEGPADALERERRRASQLVERSAGLRSTALASVERTRTLRRERAHRLHRARGGLAELLAGRTLIDDTMAAAAITVAPTVESVDDAALDELHWRYWETRERDVRDELVLRHLDLAVRIAQRFARRGEPVDDLQQVASLALVRALDRFDPSRGVRFSTYLGRVATGELKRHFRDRTWAMRVPRSLQELHLRTKSAVEYLRGELGRSPTIAEVAAQVEASEEEVLEAMEVGSAYRLRSLDAPMHADAPERHLEVATIDLNLVEAEERLTRGQLLEPLLERLSDDDRELLSLYYSEGMSQGEIGEKLQMSQVAVSRRLAKITRRLRALADVEVD